MPNYEGIPMHGDRGAYNTEDYPDEHGRDIAQDNHQVHLPHDGNDADDIVQWDGSKWVSVPLTTAGVAPNDAQYLTLAASDGLTVERILTPGTGLAGSDAGAGGAYTLSLSHLGIQSLTDPDADRIMFWDDSAGALKWLTVGTGLSITGTQMDCASVDTGTIKSYLFPTDTYALISGTSYYVPLYVVAESEYNYWAAKYWQSDYTYQPGNYWQTGA